VSTLVLVADDDPFNLRLLQELCEAAGYQVITSADGAEVLDVVAREQPDLILLDIDMPNVNGLEVTKILKADPDLSRIPLILVSSPDDEEARTAGIEAGADDYVTKPFGTRELLARVDSLARRAQAPPDPAQQIVVDDLTIDLGRCEAFRNDRRIRLTPREAGILRWLFQHRSRGVGRSELLEHVWGHAADLQTRTVDMTIANLRQKIERDPARPRIVITVKGLGYAWGRS